LTRSGASPVPLSDKALVAELVDALP
jgi:hypothetical protein